MYDEVKTESHLNNCKRVKPYGGIEIVIFSDAQPLASDQSLPLPQGEGGIRGRNFISAR